MVHQTPLTENWIFSLSLSLSLIHFHSFSLPLFLYLPISLFLSLFFSTTLFLSLFLNISVARSLSMMLPLDIEKNIFRQRKCILFAESHEESKKYFLNQIIIILNWSNSASFYLFLFFSHIAWTNIAQI